jgi:hypothetical protein
MKVAPTSYVKLEEAAKGLFPLLPRLVGAGRNTWKIDCWRVLEHTLQRAGYNYHVADNSELEECAAFTYEDLIVLRRDVYEGLFTGDVFSRSTVIHELCHIVLKHARTLHRDAVIGKHKFYEDSEWQAKTMTAAVMMPIELCQTVYSPEELAHLCGTSVQTATYRLDNLQKNGLLDPQRHKGSLFE